MRRIVFSAVAALAVVSCPTLLAQQQWRWSDVSRIVVVADVHGAYAELVSVLQATGVVDASLEWSGGEAMLVSLGDLLDRGAESRKVMDLLMRLQPDAEAQGGAVHVVMGNHELMNLTGDLRYVSAAEYAAFADDEQQEVREAAYAAFAARQPERLLEDEARAAFEQRYPPGYFGHRLAFEPDGRYGAWLLSLPALIVINDTAFVHGGLSELVASAPPGELNARIQRDLRRYISIRARLVDAGVLPPRDTAQDLELAREALRAPAEGAGDPPAAGLELSAALESFIALSEAPELGVEGPLWYRGAVYCNAFIEEPVLEDALRRLDAARVVAGHTVTDDRRARELYDGRLIMLDTGMLTRYYAGRPAALVIEGDRRFVQYLAPEQRLPLEAEPIESYGLTESKILDALAQGRLEPVEDGESGSGSPREVNVRHAGAAIRAIFYPRDRSRAADLELAAHGLDRLLGLDLVPPTVVRRIDGQDGALQLQYPDAITESDRVERGLPLGTWCAIGPQLQLMYAFDVLTSNSGRTRDDIVYRHELSALKLIDHGRAFGTERRVGLEDGTLMLSPDLEDALASLDRQQLQSTLGRWLDVRQIRALLARRDAMLEHAAAE